MLLVPWDFSLMAEFALEHALRIAKTLDKEITLLHVVEKNAPDTRKEELLVQLNEKAAEVNKLHGIMPQTIVLEGPIFSAISDYAGETEANMVIMGTHGIQGAQKITGSWALKVMSKSRTPFIVVQSPPQDDQKYQNIVFPVDFRGENKEKMKMAIFMGKYFDSKIHMLVLDPSDKGLAKKTRSNLNFAVKYLIQNNIEYEIHEVPKKRFAEQVLEFSHGINADLILIDTTKNISFADYAFGASEQFIIANSEKIPVICVIPKVSFMKLGQFMGGWGD